MTLSFQLVEGLPGCSSLSTDMQRSLMRLNHSFAHGIIPESLLDLVNGFHLGIAKLLAEFDAISLLKILQQLTIRRVVATLPHS
jgi:hypothetical protein